MSYIMEKKIEIRLVEIDDEGLLYQSYHQIDYNEYKKYLDKQNIIEEIIEQLNFKLNRLKNGNKEN